MQILKLGGSAITRKSGYMQANLPAIASLARATSSAIRQGAGELVIVHGAGSFGHAPVLKYGLGNGVRTARQKRGCKITQKACACLSCHVILALSKVGVRAVSIPPHSIIKSRNGRIAKLNYPPIASALRNGFVPVLYGDMVPDSKLGCSVCSGDQIVSHIAQKAKRVVMATNVDGVMAGGKLVQRITRANFASVARHIKGSGAPDVTGGMAGKLREIMQCRAPSFIVNAKKPERVRALLLGRKAISTRVN
jgi:isopentenyl phosphate kinase